ncbi:hypothetical protein BDA99DRAFT_529652, partial [Phascolomyces articulosus]
MVRPCFAGTVSKVNNFLCFIMVSLRGFSFIDEQGATFNGWANLQQRPSHSQLYSFSHSQLYSFSHSQLYSFSRSIFPCKQQKHLGLL